MITFNFGKFNTDEADCGYGGGYSNLSLDDKSYEITIEEYPYRDYKVSAKEAIEFVQDNADEFFENDPEDIIQRIKEFAVKCKMRKPAKQYKELKQAS